MERLFRLLRADEIECRVQTCKKDGISLLLYKNARCDMNILDESVGAFQWKRDHKELKGNIYCGVGILYNELDEWIWKWDAGAESYTEKEKGEASDSFKRACVNWGIGRELYTAPFIWIKAKDTNIEEYSERGETKYRCKDGFVVSDIEYDDGVISYLLVRNRRGEIVYQYGISLENATNREKLIAFCKNHNYDLKDVAKQYGLDKDTDDARYEEVLKELKKYER